MGECNFGQMTRNVNRDKIGPLTENQTNRDSGKDSQDDYRTTDEH